MICNGQNAGNPSSSRLSSVRSLPHMPGRACVLAFISFVSSSGSFALHFRHAGNVRPNSISSGENNLDSRDDCQADQFYADTIFTALLIVALMAGNQVCG